MIGPAKVREVVFRDRQVRVHGGSVLLAFFDLRSGAVRSNGKGIL